MSEIIWEYRRNRGNKLHFFDNKIEFIEKCAKYHCILDIIISFIKIN